MNELIRELAEQADEFTDNKIQMQGEYHPDWHDIRDQKFADLILQRVMEICERLGDQGMDGHYCVDEIHRRFK